jgi:hypothetical protein
MFEALQLLCYNLYLLKALMFGTLHLWDSPNLPKALYEPNYGRFKQIMKDDGIT